MLNLRLLSYQVAEARSKSALQNTKQEIIQMTGEQARRILRWGVRWRVDRLLFITMIIAGVGIVLSAAQREPGMISSTVTTVLAVMSVIISGISFFFIYAYRKYREADPSVQPGKKHDDALVCCRYFLREHLHCDWGAVLSYAATFAEEAVAYTRKGHHLVALEPDEDAIAEKAPENLFFVSEDETQNETDDRRSLWQHFVVGTHHSAERGHIYTLTPRGVQTYERLMRYTEAQSYEDVARGMARLLFWALAHQEVGHRVCFISKQGGGTPKDLPEVWQLHNDAQNDSSAYIH